MSSWRDRILKEFTPKLTRLTLVADPDSLLSDEGVLTGIQERGFELIQFEDPVAFRYVFETKFRSIWDHGQHMDLVVVIRSGPADLNRLPYDLLQTGRRLSFSLGQIFPNLNYPILTALDRGHLDKLYEAQRSYHPGVLGNNATKDFILKCVFEIEPETIRKPSDLLTMLLRRHYREEGIQRLLDQRLLQTLRQKPMFDEWPLETIVPDREGFFAFLQERWPTFLDRFARQSQSNSLEGTISHLTEAVSSADLPFDHPDVRVYVDNFFVEGFLEPVPHDKAEILSKLWTSVGIRTDESANLSERLDRLIVISEDKVPGEDARHGDWLHFANTWAELIALALRCDETLPVTSRERIRAIQSRIDATLTPWLLEHYSRLVNLPPVPPVMLHHVPRFLTRHISDAEKHKIALILVDGLSLDQWVVVKRELIRQRPEYRIRENTVFAWIPTITSVSRQAVFAGKPPMYFPSSINSTDREPRLWMQFWIDQGLTQQEVRYAKGLGDDIPENVEEMIADPKTRVAGLVVDKVDRIMHGMELGSAGMHNQVRQWARQPFLVNFLDLLLENGFAVHLTSDHGNIEATGCGRPTEGSIADLRGERVRIYPDPLLRAQVKEHFPNSVNWPQIALPENYFPLIAAGRSAFVRDGARLVGHGGVCLEELIVPIAQIELRGP